MKNLKAVLAVLALTPALVACSGEKAVKIQNGFGQKMEVLCKAQKVRFTPGQDGIGKEATKFMTSEEWTQMASRNSNGNPFAIGLAKGIHQGAINYACN